MSFSKKDLDDLKPWIDRTVHKFLGFSEPALVTAAINCLGNGFDRKKTKDKLAGLLEEGKATKLSEKIFETLEDLKVKSKAKKRTKDDLHDTVEVKRQNRFDAAPETVQVAHVVQPSPGQLTAIQIKEMMMNAQKMIEERKKAMTQIQFDNAVAKVNAAVTVPGFPSLPVPTVAAYPPAPTSAGVLLPQLPIVVARDESEKQRKIAELQAQIHAKLATRPSLMAAVNPSYVKLANLQSKPTPLILDSEGRTVDSSGKEVQLTQRMPTLKANIRAKRREQFKVNQEKVQEELIDNKFFDNRVAAKPAVRVKRMFKFHEKGKYEHLAQRLRTKCQLEKLQQEISQAAKKTGISSATKLALIAPKKDLKADEIPEVEWWDSVILKYDTYEGIVGRKHPYEKYEGITNLLEHPTQMKAPTESSKPDFLPVYLTKKERKKLRRQNRREALKEKQEKTRLGLEPPPEPKVRMANLMRVLGTEAVQDPTKIEAHVRAQMAKRQKAHEEANAARKLTTAQKRDKKVRKLKEDTSLGINVAVYRVRDLSNPSKKFKVETNANQLYMTGCVVLYRDCTVIVVEGGPKQHKKFKRLMLNRIKWSEDMVKAAEGDEKIPNKCALVWEGTTKSRSFIDVKFKVCPMETMAREHFRKFGVEHYWDLAYSSSVLEAADDA